MGYALFAQRKLVLNNQVNATELQQTQRSNEQYYLATESSSLQQQLSSLLSSQALELQPLYEKLSSADGSDARDSINSEILAKQAEFKVEEDAINQQIYLTGVKENAIEMEVKRLDTQVTTLQKQLEAVEEAEGAAIDRANPKFKGVG